MSEERNDYPKTRLRERKKINQKLVKKGSSTIKIVPNQEKRIDCTFKHASNGCKLTFQTIKELMVHIKQVHENNTRAQSSMIKCSYRTKLEPTEIRKTKGNSDKSITNPKTSPKRPTTENMNILSKPTPRRKKETNKEENVLDTSVHKTFEQTPKPTEADQANFERQSANYAINKNCEVTKLGGQDANLVEYVTVSDMSEQVNTWEQASQLSVCSSEMMLEELTTSAVCGETFSESDKLKEVVILNKTIEGGQVAECFNKRTEDNSVTTFQECANASEAFGETFSQSDKLQEVEILEKTRVGGEVDDCFNKSTEDFCVNSVQDGKVLTFVQVTNLNLYNIVYHSLL